MIALEALVSAYRWFFLQLAALCGPGWAIVLLSVLCSLLMAPLMKAVAGIVRREAEYQDVILPQIAAIKARYAGDMERHAHIQALYARYRYSPLSAVKKVLPLFVQIPFLLLTYYMLKGTAELHGVPFLFLGDLGAADCLLTRIGPFSAAVNVLPFAMTGVNLVTVVATPGFTSRDRAQAVGIALLFLALLYAAPSALLLYWTLNNAITMVRTLLARDRAGLKLLGARLAALKGLPAAVRARLVPANLAGCALALLLVALYMRLMVYMEVWFFNRFASYWLMNPVLVALSVATWFLLRREGRAVRAAAALNLAAAAAVGALYFAALASAPVSLALLKFMVAHVNANYVFAPLLALGLLPYVLGGGFRAAGRGLLAACRADGYLLLFVAALAVHYAYASANFKLPVDSVCALAGCLALPAVALAAVLGVLFRGRIAAGTLVRVAVGVCVGAYLIPMVSVEEGKLLGYGSNLALRLLVMGAVAFGLLRIRSRKPVLVFLALLLALVTGRAVCQKARTVQETVVAVARSGDSAAQAAFARCRAARHNSVYLLVYDSYAHDAVLDALHIRHAGIRKLLGEKGFTSYDAYSVGSDTVASMGAAFALGGVTQGSPRSTLAGNNVFNDFLQRAGYRTSYVLCGYEMPNRGERMPGDFYFPVAQQVKRPEMVLFPCIVRGLLSQSANTFNAYTREEWIGVKRGLIDRAGPTNSFIYAHAAMPEHAVENPTFRKGFAEEVRAYESRLALADAELQEDVRRVLAKDDDAIVVVASDHGPLLTEPSPVGTYGRLNLLDRCGVQLHVRWPKNYRPTLRLDCLQNVFLEVMICLSGDPALAAFASDGATLPIKYPLKAPAGAIEKGVIRLGADAGQPLFP